MKPSASPASNAPPTLAKINVTAPTIPLTMIVPPSKAALKPIKGAVMLTGRSFEDTIAKLPVARRITAQQLRANPRITVGTTEIDFTPMLNDPRSLSSLATIMRAMPNLVTLEAETLEAAEVTGQGLAVKSIITYRVKPGACDTPQGRTALQTVMVRCFEQKSEAQLDAAFANPADPRYVANPVKRAEVVALAKQHRAVMLKNINQRVAELRTRMKEPQLRKDLTAGVGEAEVGRLSAMSDAALTRELINQGRVKIEDVFFIPRLDASDVAKQKALLSGNAQNAAPQGGAQAANGDMTVTTPIEPMKFLTGFTLGREYEWQKRIEATIPWCLVGCEETYFAEAYAGFGAGLGLRLPFEVAGTYTFTRKNGFESASFAPSFKTVNADNAFYNAVQLPANQQFQAQELLAKFGAWAGLRADLPFVGGFDLGIPKEKPLGIDFTADLPGDFKNGQFTPPLPCPVGAKANDPCKKVPTFDKDFENLDLTGGIANIGVAGAKVFPFVRGELVSKGLTVKLDDMVDKKVQILSATEPGKTYPLGVSSSNRSSIFIIKEPSYNLGMKLTPGITARLFIDLAVWGTHWDYDVLLPQLGIEVPKGGKDFSCHESTVCDRTIAISPKGVDVKTAVASPYNTLINWYDGFDANKSLSNQCFAAERPACEAGLIAHRDKTVSELGGAIKSKPGYNSDTLAGDLKWAGVKSRSIIIGSYMKNRAGFIRAYKNECFDDGCRANIEAIAQGMIAGPSWGLDYDAKLQAIAVVAVLEEAYRASARNEVEKSKKKAGK